MDRSFFLETYIDQCLKDGCTVRWSESDMPISIYIAPFQWYEASKQREAYGYRKMVMDAMDFWNHATQHKVSFRVVNSLDASQINLKWGRVDRKSLGHCEYAFSKEYRMYSAEIHIGLSDGLVHTAYNDAGEVKHTIIHEFGHALGLLGHSPHKGDIMHVPHQYGDTEPSVRDGHTLSTIYHLPIGFNYLAEGKALNLKEPFTIEDVFKKLFKLGDSATSPHSMASPPILEEQPEVIDTHHTILSHQGLYHVATQHIQIPEEKRKSFLQGNPYKKRH